ncbi:MAG: poly-gamma-glutamate system protein [candidate division WOR-3 bacterium]
MKIREGRPPSYIIIFDALISIILCIYALSSKVVIYAPYYKEKFLASELANRYFNEIREYRNKIGIPIDQVNDPAGSGLIGHQITPITTEFGDLTAKLTSINPNFAALFVTYLKKLKVKENDFVAVHLTGSFPALNLCLLAALTTLKLRPIIITSVGSSMWGANIPGFTYLDMESFLYQNGLIKFKTAYSSYGGIDDVGRGLTLEGREIITRTIARNGTILIKANSLEESIDTKLKLYDKETQGHPIKCFINIGGNAAVIAGVEVPSGLLTERYSDHPGLIGAFLRRNIPVINIQNINALAKRYKLPVAPSYIQKPGEGKLFTEIRYSTKAAFLSLVLILLLLAFSLIVDVDFYMKKLLRRFK